MNVKSFQINGFQVEIRAEKLPGKMVGVTLYISDSKVDNVDLDVKEEELEKTADRLERLLKKNLSM